MKTLLIIIDGLSEERIPELDNLTPLEYAFTPNISRIKSKGIHIKKVFCPPNRDPDSMTCILTMLGVEETLIPRNRAYLEALASDIAVGEDEVAMRCNLVSLKDNKLESFNGQYLSKCEMKSLSQKVKTSENVKFYHISDYRSIVVLKKDEELMKLDDLPPHENIGTDIDVLVRQLRKSKELSAFLDDNKIKIDGREYMFYPWGVSQSIELPTFEELHKKTCSCVCCAEIVKGIAKAMKIHVPILKNSTGDVDTDLGEKVDTVLEEIKEHDVVIAHINGTDEVAHRKDIEGKVKFIEKIDREFISKIYKNIINTKIIIISDHQTSSITGKHEKGLIDVIIAEL